MYNNCKIFRVFETETTRANYNKIMAQDGEYECHSEVVGICELYKVTVAIFVC
jgi:hypothetical protein